MLRDNSQKEKRQTISLMCAVSRNKARDCTVPSGNKPESGPCYGRRRDLRIETLMVGGK